MNGGRSHLTSLLARHHQAQVQNPSTLEDSLQRFVRSLTRNSLREVNAGAEACTPIAQRILPTREALYEPLRTGEVQDHVRRGQPNGGFH